MSTLKMNQERQPTVIEQAIESAKYVTVAANIERLAQNADLADPLTSVYLGALEESPFLYSTDVHLSKLSRNGLVRGTPGIAQQLHDDFANYRVVIADSLKSFQKFIRTRPKLIDLIGEQLDVEPATVAPQLLGQFVLAHELGHIDTWVRGRAGELSPTHHLEDKVALGAMPFPVLSPGELGVFLKTPQGILFWRDVKQRYAERGINSRSELLTAQEIAYRQTPEEEMSDQFAVRVLKRVSAIS